MHNVHEFLQTLAIVLCVAAVTTVVFQRLKQPVVLGYLLAGMVVGPHIPIPLQAESDVVHTLAELGVILLMFSLGLEFSLSKLLKVGVTASFVAVVQCSLMVWLGYVIGQVFGWQRLESLYAGAIIAISSTTIIVKAFEEQGVSGGFTHIVFGILIVEDLVAILLITILTALSSGEGLSVLEVGRTAARLAGFLAVTTVAGLLIVPRLMRVVVRLDRAETTVVASVGLAFGFALLASVFGYSVALGAFLAGALVAESGVEKQIEHLVQPVRDIFAAIFFVSVGMLIDPAEVYANWLVVLVFLAAVIAGKILSVSISAFFTGQSIQSSLRIGMSVAQIGEFSFIIAGIGVAAGAIDNSLYSMAVAVSAITTLLTPWLIRAAPRVAAWIDRKLPRSMQTFAALYSSWLEQLATRREQTEISATRRAARWLIVDAIVAALIVIGASVEADAISAWMAGRWGLGDDAARILLVAGAALLSAPFWVGAIRMARQLGFEVAARAFPAAGREQLDLAAAPRRLLVVAIQLGIVVAVGLPLVAITQPFLPAFGGAIVLLLIVVLLAFVFWRRAANFQGHARAGAQALADALGRQMQSGDGAAAHASLDDANRILAGLGSPTPVEIRAGSPLVGKTLSQINLRGITGATILAIKRGDQSVLIPSGHDQLEAGDILAVAGTRESVDAAKNLLSVAAN
jgi:K+:H+ antiporter